MSGVEPLTSFDWTAKKPLAFRPFKPVYHITMAVQNSTPADLIVMDHNYEDRVLERRQLMTQNPTIVLGAIPQAKASVEELYAFLLSQYLPQRFPTMFSLSEDGKIFRNGITGASFPTLPPDDSVQALRRLGETIEDDMFLLHETEKGHRSVAYVCCYCSGFDPSQKLDKLLPEIHEPVPSYNKIGPSMERYFKKLEVGKNVKRVNVSECVLLPRMERPQECILDVRTDVLSMEVVRRRFSHPLQSQRQPRERGRPGPRDQGRRHRHKQGDVPPPPGARAETQELTGCAQARIRCELQTLSRLPKTGALLFSFKTHLYTLEEIKSEGLGPQLADAIDGLGKGNAPGMWQYKGALRLGKKVNEYLRS